LPSLGGIGTLAAMLLPHDRTGEGEPPVLLIPGANGHRLWMSLLARRFAERHRTVAVTLPGESEAAGLGPDPHDASFPEIVTRLTEVLDACGVPRAVVCGTSFGGIAAVALALAHPERVSALVLHATTARPARRLRRFGRLARQPLLATLVFNAIFVPRLPAEFRASLPHPRQRRRFYRELLSLRRTIPLCPAAFGRRLRRLVDVDLTAELSRLSQPVLTLSGEAGLDPIVGPEESEWIAAHTERARHEILPRTGHLAILARPDLIVRRAERFLAEWEIGPRPPEAEP
jgi:pimeloyl-ACP methyl ester carboxylesterase